ncbi:MAG: DUF4326 domain-containing protein [Micrococcales bacterium]|nr:DUF4326 domain-containing protein [Micrococcales bacterium]
MSPVRVQMSRSHAWRAENRDAIRVDRLTRWGNPFRVEQRGGAWMVIDENGVDYPVWNPDCPGSAVEHAVFLFDWALRAGLLPIKVADVQRVLAGYDLACWCDPDAACHADVLLTVANDPQLAQLEGVHS